MGCDFFWKGSIPFSALQEKTVRFVLSYFADKKMEDLVAFHPKPLLVLPTRVPRRSADQGESIQNYPHDYFGVAPFYKWKPARGFYQFVFDRSDFGRMITIWKTPEIQDEQQRPEQEEHEFTEPDFQVDFWNGGHCRVGEGGAPALLLHIIKLRYCPNLEMGDDYGYCEEVGGRIEEWGLTKIFQKRETSGKEDLGFDACHEIYRTEFEKRYPRPARGAPTLRLAEEPTLKFHPITPEEAAALVEEIELSVRTKGCLLRAGLRTIGDVVQKSPQELLKIDYFGTKSLREIVCILADMGLELRQEKE